MVKNSIFLFIAFVLFVTNVNAVPPSSVWPANQLPIRFVMDSTTLPRGITNLSVNRLELVNSISKWNENDSLGSMLYIAQGNVNNNMAFTFNGVNEIKFQVWDYDNIPDLPAAVTKTKRYTTNEKPCINTPKEGCIRQREESDILFNPSDYQFYIGDSVPSGCNNLISANTIFRHEVGHALGIKHFGTQLMTGGIINACKNLYVKHRDINKLKRMYPSKDTVEVHVQSPSENQTLIINQSNNFVANISTFFNKNISLQEIKAVEDTMVWSSSIDGVIAHGNNVDVQDLSSGLHELFVTVGQVGDSIYGEGSSSFFVIDSVTDIIDVFGNVIASPFPCPRAVNSSVGACLFTVKQFISFGNCIYTLSQSTTYVEDLPTGAELGSGNRFTPNREAFPVCDWANPLAGYYYDIESWIYDTVNPDQVNYHLFNSTSRVGQVVDGVHHYFYNIPLVEPEIYVTPIADCNVTNPSQKCSVSINYQDKFFLPDAGIFYRDLGVTDWTPLYSFPPGSDGTINTGNIVSVGGTEIAIFQYGNNVYWADRPFPQAPMITAPNGMVAGPFSVKAIAPVEPDVYEHDDSNLSNHNVIGINNPKQHHNFSDDSVDWIKLNNQSFNQALNLSGGNCDNLSCKIELSNISDNLNLCYQFVAGGVSTIERCGITNGNYTNIKMVLSNSDSGSYPSQCDADYILGWGHIKLTDGDSLPSGNKSYDVKFSCSFDSL